jgi:hypothetical protein
LESNFDFIGGFRGIWKLLIILISRYFLNSYSLPISRQAYYLFLILLIFKAKQKFTIPFDTSFNIDDLISIHYLQLKGDEELASMPVYFQSTGFQLIETTSRC